MTSNNGSHNMAAQTEEDLKNEWKAQLGGEKGAYYHHIWHQLHHMHLVWSELRTILKQDKKGEKLLKDTIPLFCGLVTNSMWKELIVGLCGFSDPYPQKRKKPKLWKRPLLCLLGYAHLYADERSKPNSVSFPFWLRDHTDNLNDQQKQELKDAITTYTDRLSPIRRMRDKYIGHWNADAWFRWQAGQVKQEFIGRTLKDIEDVLNMIERQNGLTSWDMKAGPAPKGGAENLLLCLRAAQEKWAEDDLKRAASRAKDQADRGKRREDGAE